MNFKELLMKAKQGDKGARGGTVFDVPSHGVKQVQNQRNISEDLYQELSKTFVSCIEQFSIEGTENEQK